MSEKKRRKVHTSEFKAKVGLEALKGVKTINEIGQEYGVHPVQVGQWKKAIQEQAKSLFDSKRCPKPVKWDMFVSYRATQSMFVRQIADQLTSAGGKIWFGEYITFDWQLRQDESWLQSQISAGTFQCEWGLIFASEDYLNSPYCMRELEQLLERRGLQRMLQISLDGTELFAKERCETIRASDNVMEVVDFIVARIGLKMDTPARPGRPLQALSRKIRFDSRFQLDTYGWRKWWWGSITKHLFSYDPRQPWDWSIDKDPYAVRWGPALLRDTSLKEGDSSEIVMNLRYGRELTSERDEFSVNFTEIKNAGQEKEILNRLNKYVSQAHLPYVEEIDVQTELKGVHVLISDEAFGHMAVTYKVITKTGSMWIRKVSVHRPENNDPSSYYEFVFTFRFRGTFREYCRHTGVMDDLALSITVM